MKNNNRERTENKAIRGDAVLEIRIQRIRCCEKLFHFLAWICNENALSTIWQKLRRYFRLGEPFSMIISR